MRTAACGAAALAVAAPPLTGAGSLPPPEERLVLVVHRSNPLDNLTLSDARRIFRGERRKWPNGRNVTVVMRNPGAPERAAVLRRIYEMNEDEFARYFLHATFTGEVSSPPKQVNGAHWMVRFIFNVPGAIGYVRASDLDDTVKPLRIGGISHEDPRYPLLIETEEPDSESEHGNP